MNATELIALVMLAQDDPEGTYLLELDGQQLTLWRMTEAEPEDMAYSILPDELVHDARSGQPLPVPDR
jgi:hypothetical protein